MLRSPFPQALPCLLAAVITAQAAPLLAQQKRATAIEEIIVTAQKREESLQDTPISIAAFDSETLEKFGINNLEDLTALATNVDITPFPNSRATMVVFMRGVGNNDAQTTQDPSVGVYLDGVYVARSAGLGNDVADIERIEVLRGPQGTLYGRNTTGGAVNIITRKPDGELSLSHTISTGNRDYTRNRTQIDTPDWGGFAGSLTYMTMDKQGYVENTGPGGSDFSAEDKQAGRVSLRWDATDTISLRYAYDLSEVAGPQNYYQPTFVISKSQENQMAAMDPAGFGVIAATGILDYFRTIENDERNDSGAWTFPARDSNLDIKGHTFIAQWDLSFGQLKLTSSKRELEESIYIEYGAGWNAQATPGGFFNVNVDIEHEQTSHELQLVGDIGERWNYVAGLYYFEEEGYENEFDTSFAISQFGDPTVLEDRTIWSENEATAIYGQLGWRPPLLDDRLELILGGRYSTDDRTARKRSVNFENGPQQDSESFSSFNPSFTADFSWTDSFNVYGKVVTGYKSGGFNVRSTEAGFSPAFDQEDMVAMEIGAKAKLFDQRVQLNFAAFDSEYDNMQIQQITDNTKIFLTDVFNVGKAEISGFELDILAIPVTGLTLGLSWGYTDAQFIEYIEQAGKANIADQAEMPYAPEHSYTASLDYLFPEMGIGDLRLNIDYAWRDERSGTAVNADMKGFFLDDYGLLKARLSLSNIDIGPAKVQLAIWGNNLTDEEYLVHQISFGFARTGVWNEPARYGADLTVSFD